MRHPNGGWAKRRRAATLAPAQPVDPEGGVFRPRRLPSAAVVFRLALRLDVELPDLDALAIELVQLERRELQVSALRNKLHERLASFPNELTQRRERDVSAERAAIHARIDELRAQLAPLRRYLA